MQTHTLKFRWSISPKSGYNVCTLRRDGTKVASCNGGGYDMEGTCLGDYVARNYAAQLRQLTVPFYGLTWHDPHFDPSQLVMADGRTIAEREATDATLGLEQYQAYYGAASNTPTERHVIPEIDGVCGFSAVEAIMRAIGLKLERLNQTTNDSTYRLSS